MPDPLLTIGYLRRFGAPRRDLDRLHTKLAALSSPNVVPFPVPKDVSPHRRLLARDLGFDPGPLSDGMRQAAKKMYLVDLYSGGVLATTQETVFIDAPPIDWMRFWRKVDADRERARDDPAGRG